MGVPMLWKDFDAIPTHGVLEAMYMCSLDCISLATRHNLVCDVGGWQEVVAAKDRKAGGELQWWAVLSDVPQAVVTLVEFLVTRFKSLQQALVACDGGLGDGKLNAREFTTGMLRLGFNVPSASKKRKTKRRSSTSSVAPGRAQSANGRAQSANHSAMNTDEVLMSAYRFLDPNGDGAVTAKEFDFLEGVWRELAQSTWEFVRLVRERFGSVAAAWQTADEDASGAIDFDEFQRLAQAWHFRGPLRQIFFFLQRVVQMLLVKRSGCP